MNKEFKKIIKEMDGSLLAIGIDDELAEEINKNEKITKCDILNYFTKKETKGKNKKIKIIRIKKLRKIFKHKKTDYIICNYEQVKDYLKTFIKDSVYINSKYLYFYGDVDDIVIKKYSRYNVEIEKKNKIVKINNTKSKNNRIKELYYRIIDGISDAIEIIGNVLMG